MPREHLARARAKELKSILGLTDLPVMMTDVCAALGHAVDWDARVPRGDDAVTMQWGGLFGIYLKNSLTHSCRVRFTLAHEIGHIRINHFQEYDLRFSSCPGLGKNTVWRLNREANVFAEELLMPADFIVYNHWRGLEYLADACGVSTQAMEIRLKNLNLVVPAEAAK